MITNVYVDAFNLYYGCLKDSPYRWLNLSALCQIMLPKDTIHKIKYFTAKVSARPNDPDQPTRQQTYLRALKTITNLEIIYGSFLTHNVPMRLANPLPGQNPIVTVIRTSEKGSDVNLATHLLCDGRIKETGRCFESSTTSKPDVGKSSNLYQTHQTDSSKEQPILAHPARSYWKYR